MIDASEQPPPARASAAWAATSEPATTRIEYRYFANFAVALCEGPIAGIGRVWADGKPLDLGQFHASHLSRRRDAGARPPDRGEAGQGDAPAYRGTAYVVFERLPLENFGNRIPQLSFEVFRAGRRFEKLRPAVTLIPGATEFGYEPATVVREIAPGATVPENVHMPHWRLPTGRLARRSAGGLPNLERVALVVGWFGNDLRAGRAS